jgi:hypothetical protein
MPEGAHFSFMAGPIVLEHFVPDSSAAWHHKPKQFAARGPTVFILLDSNFHRVNIPDGAGAPAGLEYLAIGGRI